MQASSTGHKRKKVIKHYGTTRSMRVIIILEKAIGCIEGQKGKRIALYNALKDIYDLLCAARDTGLSGSLALYFVLNQSGGFYDVWVRFHKTRFGSVKLARHLFDDMIRDCKWVVKVTPINN